MEKVDVEWKNTDTFIKSLKLTLIRGLFITNSGWIDIFSWNYWESVRLYETGFHIVMMYQIHIQIHKFIKSGAERK